MNVGKLFRIVRLFEAAQHFGRAVNRYTVVYPAWERYGLFGLLALWGWSCTRAQPEASRAEHSTNSIEALSTVYDVEGNAYQTIRLGNQLWMAENLKATRFSNGDSIPKKDALYTWENVQDARGICPEGWRIPGRADWDILSDYAGGDIIAGKLLLYARQIMAAPNAFTLDDLLFGMQSKRGLLLAAPADAQGSTTEAIWWGQDELLLGSDHIASGDRRSSWKKLPQACRCVYDQQLVQPFSWAPSELWKHTRALKTNNIYTSKEAYSKLIQKAEGAGEEQQHAASTNYLWLLINLERFSFQRGTVVLNIANPQVQRVVVYQKNYKALRK